MLCRAHTVALQTIENKSEKYQLLLVHLLYEKRRNNIFFSCLCFVIDNSFRDRRIA